MAADALALVSLQETSDADEESDGVFRPHHVMAMDPSLLDPYDRLIDITVENRPCQVPENNTVLRSLQYLEVDLYPCRLCWNGECDNCHFSYLDPASGIATLARGCETLVCEGMRILRIPANARWPASTAEASCHQDSTGDAQSTAGDGRNQGPT